MSIIAPPASSGGSFEPVAEGTHLAVCDRVVYLGHQKQEWSGEVSFKPKVYIRFQVPAIRVEVNDEDKPAIIGTTLTLSMHEKAKLHKFIKTWLGKAPAVSFDVATLLGLPCQIAVSHNVKPDRTYANVDGVMSIPQGMEGPKLEGEPILFEGPQQAAVLALLPQWMQEKIAVGFSTENPNKITPEPEPHPEVMPAGQRKPEFDEDIPF